jgi:hypothetical protein
MLWTDELIKIAAEAEGDMGILCALIALRHTENGGPGREYGVLSEPAPTYEDQLRIASHSLRNHIQRVMGRVPIRDTRGFLTPEFLQSFSQHWAPIGAGNDLNNLNKNHATNLVRSNENVSNELWDTIIDIR